MSRSHARRPSRSRQLAPARRAEAAGPAQDPAAHAAELKTAEQDHCWRTLLNTMPTWEYCTHPACRRARSCTAVGGLACLRRTPDARAMLLGYLCGHLGDRLENEAAARQQRKITALMRDLEARARLRD